MNLLGEGWMKDSTREKSTHKKTHSSSQRSEGWKTFQHPKCEGWKKGERKFIDVYSLHDSIQFLFLIFDVVCAEASMLFFFCEWANNSISSSRRASFIAFEVVVDRWWTFISKTWTVAAHEREIILHSANSHNISNTGRTFEVESHSPLTL